jgi:hypothetical protein
MLYTTIDLYKRPNQSLKISKMVELKNPTNTVVEFKWSPVMSGRGISFSMRPASGSVLPNSSLFCEISFHPSFTAPDSGQFELHVDGNNTIQNLNCQVDLGSSSVQFHDRRINFGTIPLNIETDAEIFLKNISPDYPAIYHLSIPAEFDKMVILEPTDGVLQIGEVRRIRFALRPYRTGKFDFPITAQLSNGKETSIRLGGVAEPPNVGVDVSQFNFHSVPINSRICVPFRLKNYQKSDARCSFDLPNEFCVNLDPVGTEYDISPGEEIELKLYFCPKLIGSYEFVLPLIVNQIRTFEISELTRKPLVIAATAQNKLVLSPSCLNLSFSSPSQEIEIFNQSDDQILNFILDFDPEILEIFDEAETNRKVELVPNEKMKFKIRIKRKLATFGVHFLKIVQDEKFESLLEVNYTNDQSTIEFEPTELVLETAPLDTFIDGFFSIKTQNMTSASPLQLELPKLDPDEILEFDFLNDSDQPTSSPSDLIEVKVRYKAQVAKNSIKRILVKEKNSAKCASLDIHVSTDNSILSTYSFVALSAQNYQIVRVENQIKMIPRFSSTDSTSSSPSITPFTSGPATHQMDEPYSRNILLKTPTLSTNVSSSKHPSNRLRSKTIGPRHLTCQR